MFCIILSLLWLLNILAQSKVIIETTTAKDDPVARDSATSEFIAAEHKDIFDKMKEGSLLLETYLKDKSTSNIIRMYMTCQGFASKGAWLYKTRLYADASQFYNDQYDFWYNNQHNECVFTECLQNMRDWNARTFS